MFGDAFPGPSDPVNGGKTKHRPFHTYTMKQAIDEGFLIDVLKYYTPIASYYRLEAVVETDPMFDRKRAQKKLRKYVERHDHAIRLKAEIMVDYFQQYVLVPRKIGGESRAMVICSGIPEAVKYYRSIKSYLEEIKSPYKAIVAFSGETDVGGQMMTESRRRYQNRRHQERFGE